MFSGLVNFFTGLLTNITTKLKSSYLLRLVKIQTYSSSEAIVSEPISSYKFFEMTELELCIFWFDGQFSCLNFSTYRNNEFESNQF